MTAQERAHEKIINAMLAIKAAGLKFYLIEYPGFCGAALGVDAEDARANAGAGDFVGPWECTEISQLLLDTLEAKK